MWWRWHGGLLALAALMALAATGGGALRLVGRLTGPTPAAAGALLAPSGDGGTARSAHAVLSAEASATVTVQPTRGLSTDTFTFTLAGFAPGERVVVSVQPPPEAVDLLHELAGLPEDTATTVNETGTGQFALRPAEAWGPSPPGIWRVRFTGEASGASADAAIELLWCGC